MTLGEIRRRPTLPGRFQPSTISVLRLNFCVRDGNRWIPQAIVTGNMGLLRSASVVTRFSFALASALPSLASSFAFPRTLKTAQVGAPLTPDQGVRFSPLTFTFASPFGSAFHKPFLPRSWVSGLFRLQVPRLALPFPVRSASPLLPLPYSLFPLLLDQALDRLVSSSSIRYRTSTDDLSTLSSSRGLTHF